MCRSCLSCRCLACWVVVLGATISCLCARGQGIQFSGPPPGEATAQIDGDRFEVANDAIVCRWSITDGRFKPVSIIDKFSGAMLSLDVERSECFRIITDTATLAASQMRIVDGPTVETIAPQPDSTTRAKRLAGKRIRLALIDAAGELRVEWMAELRDGSNYVRPVVWIDALKQPVHVNRIVLPKLVAPAEQPARVAGTVPGSPITLGPFFFAYEHANATALAATEDNLALGKPATASGQFQQLAASLAVDGDLTRQRHWGATDVPVWWQVDLEQAASIDRVHLFPWYGDGRHYQYKVETSLDGQTWQTAVDRSTNEQPSTQAGDDLRFPARQARLVRVTITHNSAGNHFGGHLIEVRVYRADADRDAPPATVVQCALDRNAAVTPDKAVEQSSVVGVVPPGQMRRAFLHYVERERAHPYRPFLHYNSWYDTSWPGHRMHEAECVEAIELFGRELVERRGVPLKCFLLDDGWDDTQTLWRIDETNFPRGFDPLLEAARQYDSTLGFWLSPWGGYGDARRRRVEAGRQQGFETVGDQFSMAGPNYFERYLDASRRMVEQAGCNHFKYDGMSAARIEESAAMVRLIAELRRLRPDLFVNMTTGTWPSPFYLWHGDSTWRGGGDMGFAGPGSKREQWITYRDAETFHGVVRRGPLYPLNSLMTQGIAHAKYGLASQLGADRDEMRREMRSFFASGTCVQELYITPQMMSAENWDDLAEAARWAAANADVLVDTHWVGGDPRAGEIYGWASWTPRKAVLALRNPSDKPQQIELDLATVFELPQGAPQRYQLKSPYPNDAAQPLDLADDDKHTFNLEPFQVLVFDATP